MKRVRVILALMTAYALFAVLLNSVGTVILQSIETWGVSKTQASTLEAFKDLPIAVASFTLASFLPRFGYRASMIAGLLLVGSVCALVPLLDAFWAMRLLFLAIGVSFAVTKVAVYATVGLLTDTAAEHASLLNLIEGVFMLGVLGGYWLFSGFIDAARPGSSGWLGVYWVLAGAAGFAILLLLGGRFDESAAHRDASRPMEEAGRMLGLFRKPLTAIFVACVFFYVLIEQGLGTWLPTFNRELLGLSAPMSVQAASIFAVGLAAGRLAAGLLVRRTGWYPLLVGCLVGLAALIVVALPLAEASGGARVERWADAPVAAFVLPLAGLFMAPIYPAINSAILSALPRPDQAGMVGLIVVFSALGGTTGSLIVGRVFAATGGVAAFYLLLLPVTAVLFCITILRRLAAAERPYAPA